MKQQTTSPTAEANARKMIRALLDGQVLPNLEIADCGDWHNTIEPLLQAHAQGGTDAVRKAFSAAARSHPPLAQLVAGGEPAVPQEAEASAAEQATTSFVPVPELEHSTPSSIDPGAVTSITWQPPTPLIDDDVPPAFPLDVFPPWLRDACYSVAVATQTPVDLSAFVALGGIATAVQRKIEVEVRKGWTEPLSLFLLAVLPSGEGKSPVFKMLSQPIYDAEMKKYQASETENIDSRIEQAQLEHKASTLQQEARKASTEAEERQLLESAKQAAREAENLEPMPAPRLLATDATPERIASLLYENEERIAIYSDESAALEVMCGRYSSRGTPPNLDVFLNGWSGGYVRPERRSGGYGPVRGAALTFCIAAQPSVLRDLARRPELANRGVLARFLYCLPTSLVGSRLADPPPADQDTMHQYARNLDALLQLPVPRADSDNEDVPPRKRAICPLIVRLSAEAYQELVAFKCRIEPSLANGGANEDYRAWMAKAASQAIRLAGLLHIAWRRQAGDYRPWESPIPGERMKDAISIVDYAREHMVRAHGFSLALSLHQEQAHKCIRMLQRRAWSSINSRQLQQHAHLAKEDADAVIGLLEDHGYIRSYIPEKMHRNNRQRHFLVNPYVLSVPSGPPHPEKLTGMDGMGDSVSSDGASGAAQEAGSTASQSDGSVYYDEDFDLEDGYSNLAETLYACVDPEDKDLVSYILRAVESDAYDDARDFARLYGGNGLLRILEQWIKNTEDR